MPKNQMLIKTILQKHDRWWKVLDHSAETILLKHDRWWKWKVLDHSAEIILQKHDRRWKVLDHSAKIILQKYDRWRNVLDHSAEIILKKHDRWWKVLDHSAETIQQKHDRWWKFLHHSAEKKLNTFELEAILAHKKTLHKVWIKSSVKIKTWLDKSHSSTHCKLQPLHQEDYKIFHTPWIVFAQRLVHLISYNIHVSTRVLNKSMFLLSFHSSIMKKRPCM